MEIKHLKTLLTIIQLGTYEKAALELNYAQSTITFQMQQLGEDLGITLFEKVGRNLRLTDDARLLLPQIRRLVAEYDDLVTFSRPLCEMTGQYRIAAAESLLLYQVQPLIRAFHERLPKMDLAIDMVTNNALEELVRVGAADIGIYYQNTSANATVFRKKHWATYPTVLVGRPTDTAGENVSQTRISGDVDSNYDRAYSNLLELSGQQFTTLNVGSVTAAKKEIVSGIGVGILPEFMVADELANGVLVDLTGTLTLPNVDVVSLTRADEPSGRITQTVEELLSNLDW